MNTPSTIFDKIDLSDTSFIYFGQLPNKPPFLLDSFSILWDLHPQDYHTLKMHGKDVKTPRWQQAYGKDYRYTGSKNNALPITENLQPYLNWAKERVHSSFNGMLVNWYDGMEKHYIGPHRDDARDLVKGSPILTISLGEERVFRFRPWKAKGFKDITLYHGDAVIIPYETNLHWTHEVPYFKKYQGKRISITLREFV